MKQKFQMRPRTTLFISSLLFFAFFFCLEAWAQEKNVTSVTTEKKETDNEPSTKLSPDKTVETDDPGNHLETCS